MQLQENFDLGYRIGEPTKWYGLWCPALDCFVLVHYDLDLVEDLQCLASNKVLTVIVTLDTELAKQNLIDNSCCVNWTVKAHEGINFTLVYQQINKPYLVDIMPCSTADREQAQQVADWFMFALNWVKWAKAHQRKHRSQYFICHVMDLPFVDLKKKIYKILLMTADIQQADQQIQALVKS